jgi:hypothetical protein
VKKKSLRQRRGNASRAKETRRRRLRNSKRRIERRLVVPAWEGREAPSFTASNIKYEMSGKARGIAVGGIGAFHALARRTGLIDEINNRVRVFKIHNPYFESDHVLNIAYNIACGGTCLEDMELLRVNENYLNALGTKRSPDPTTSGDFCRRFSVHHIEALLTAINETRLRVWQLQPKDFFEEAVIDADGTMATTLGECKQGMDINHKGEWGYHPLVLTLSNTGEPLYLVNRSGNRPSHEGAAQRFDQAIDLTRRGGFRAITLRGDTDFSQTEHLDRWDGQGIEFVFGFDAKENLTQKADSLEDSAWRPLKRREKYVVKTEPRTKPERVKEKIVEAREYLNIHLLAESYAEFTYSPVACKKDYRMVVVKKNLSLERGENVLFSDVRYFFYITNKPADAMSPEEVVFFANDRCDQEKLIDQFKSGVHALRMPVDNLLSNWAYMVMAGLAWTLKAWFGLLLPENGRWAERRGAEKRAVIRMGFKKFLNVFMRIPAQIITSGRHILFRLLDWNPWRPVFFRAFDAIQDRLRC